MSLGFAEQPQEESQQDALFWNEETLRIGMEHIGEADIQPPLDAVEQLALTGLLNQQRPKTWGIGEEDEIRYKIVIRARSRDDGLWTYPPEPRYVDLRRVVEGLAANEEVIRKMVAQQQELQADQQASLVAEA